MNIRSNILHLALYCDHSSFNAAVGQRVPFGDYLRIRAQAEQMAGMTVFVPQWDVSIIFDTWTFSSDVDFVVRIWDAECSVLLFEKKISFAGISTPTDQVTVWGGLRARCFRVTVEAVDPLAPSLVVPLNLVQNSLPDFVTAESADVTMPEGGSIGGLRFTAAPGIPENVSIVLHAEQD